MSSRKGHNISGGFTATSKEIVIPVPKIRIVEQSWSRTNAHGDLMTGERGIFLQVHDCPDGFFDDPALDARIELLRWTKFRSNERVLSGSPRGESAWRHPDCSVNPIGGAKTRGGSQEVPRQSAWQLLGSQEYDLIGRITLEDYFYMRSLQIFTPTGEQSVGPFPVMTGSKQASYNFSLAQVNRDNPTPKYKGQKLNQYFRFRISIQNPDGDGTKGDRLTGPETETLWARPFPYPIFPTGDGYADAAPSTNRLTFSMKNGVSGN